VIELAIPHHVRPFQNSQIWLRCLSNWHIFEDRLSSDQNRSNLSAAERGRARSARQPTPCSGARTSMVLLPGCTAHGYPRPRVARARSAVPPAPVSARLFLARLRSPLFAATGPGQRRGCTGEIAGADPTARPLRRGARPRFLAPAITLGFAGRCARERRIGLLSCPSPRRGWGMEDGRGATRAPAHELRDARVALYGSGAAMPPTTAVRSTAAHAEERRSGSVPGDQHHCFLPP
jgi:hypothetical protein